MRFGEIWDRRHTNEIWDRQHSQDLSEISAVVRSTSSGQSRMAGCSADSTDSANSANSANSGQARMAATRIPDLSIPDRSIRGQFGTGDNSGQATCFR